MLSWQIGDVKVSRVVEMELPVPYSPESFFLKEATPEALAPMKWLFPHFAKEDGTLMLSIHALLVEAPGKKLVVDTCVGNDRPRSILGGEKLQTKFLDHMKEAGFTRDNVDAVVCTHLHVDHVGWNTMLQNGKWVPTFPNARYLIGGTEWDFFSRQTDDFFKAPVDDSIRPIFDHSMAELVDDGRKLSDELWLEATPGHTPGHFSVRISSKGQNAIITGDMMHHPIQCRYPDWDDNFDVDLAHAKRTRRAFCERYADTGTLVFGTHFATPSAGKIVKKDDSFRFILE